MKYGTIKNGVLELAPRIINDNGNRIFNPSDDQYISFGYLPLVKTEPPVTDEQHYAIPHWEKQNNQIVQSWTIEEILITEEEEEQALTRYANELTGASDPDLISAAETLITERIKEES